MVLTRLRGAGSNNNNNNNKSNNNNNTSCSWGIRYDEEEN